MGFGKDKCQFTSHSNSACMEYPKTAKFDRVLPEKPNEQKHPEFWAEDRWNCCWNTTTSNFNASIEGGNNWPIARHIWLESTD